MKKFSLILNNYIFFILSMLVYLIVISALGHFSLFSYKVVSVISYVFMVILFFITGFKLGNRSISKGYLSGLIMGLSNVLLMVLLGIIFKSIPGVTSIIYYSTLILSSVIGGMFGINRKGSPL